MIDLLKSILDLIGKRFWGLVTAIVAAILCIIAITFATPITVDIYSCVQREEAYQMHDTKYTVKSIIKKDGKAEVKLCINEQYKTVRTNLVEK